MMDISLQKERLTSEGEAQAEGDVAIRRGVVDTNRNTTVPRTVAPATATDHAVRPSIRTGGIVLRRTAITAIPVATPFPYVATHIVDAQLVGRLGGNGVSFRGTVIIIPSHIINRVAATIFVAPTLIATASGELPFGFGRQAEVLAGEGIQFANKGLTIFPRNVLYRQV